MAPSVGTSQPAIKDVGVPESPLTPRDAEEFARFRDVFEEHMPSSKRPIGHDSTAVMMLSFESNAHDPKGSDLTNEVKKLESVFKDDYNFRVVNKVIGGKSPGLELHRDLSAFAMENNKDHALLIVYYAGHAWRSTDIKRIRDGGFDLLPVGRDYLQANPETHVMWEVSETILQQVNCDVLVIFDCCDAGYTSSLRSGGHAFEYLAACQERKFTYGPGENSFTSAMIWALKELNTGEHFTTATLREKIMKYPLFPSKQQPVLFTRKGYLPEHIWIAPHTHEAKMASPTKRRRHSTEPEFRDDDCNFVDFRLFFNRHLSASDAERVARMMTPLVTNSNLPINARHVSVLQKSVCREQASKRHAGKWRKAKTIALLIQRWRGDDLGDGEDDSPPRKIARTSYNSEESTNDSNKVVKVVAEASSLKSITSSRLKKGGKAAVHQPPVPALLIAADSDLGPPSADVEMEVRLPSPGSENDSSTTYNSPGEFDESLAPMASGPSTSDPIEALMGNLNRLDTAQRDAIVTNLRAVFMRTMGD